MANGSYIAPERVVRNGKVVCFKGEVMTTAEAERRGLVKVTAPPVVEAVEPEQGAEPEPEAAPEPEAVDVAALVAGNKLDELKAMADELGAEYPKDATKAVVAKAIAEARAAKAAE